MATKIQIRRGTSTEWAAANPTLADGELAVETDTKQLKIGDGSTAYNSLAYVATGNMDVASSNLDDLADGTTYKRVAAAVATALNAGTYDAAKVSAFGIGTIGSYKNEDLNTITLGGMYRVTYNASYHFPTGVSSTLAYLLVVPGVDTNQFAQVLFDRDTYTDVWIRKKVTSFGSWSKIWTSGNDGNGGQPPAPKARGSQTTSATNKDTLLIGEEWIEDLASGASATRPNCGGTVVAEVLTYGCNVSTWLHLTMDATGTNWGTANANCRVRYTRIA